MNKQTYKLGDNPTFKELRALRTANGPNLQAVATGEKRPPRAGEWYLSGAEIRAYRAANDLSSDYHIARLCVVETVTVTRIVRELQ